MTTVSASVPLLLGEAKPFLALLFGLGILFVLLLAVTISRILYVCQPNEVLVFSGRTHRTPDGGRRGYRIVRGGRALRVPLLETVDRMDLTNMIIDVTVRNAYSKGGIPLSVQGIANLKIPGEQPLLDNTLERFLGKSRAEIMKIARETLEGNLRGVLATLTPEEVNQDKERFATQLAAEAEHDFHRLGLVLDTLKIQNVSDDVGYLDAIGRKRSAEIRRTAQVAEAEAQAEAAEQKWRNTMNAELAKIASRMEIAIKENERRIADATTRRAARIAEQVAEVQALVAKARAELEMQEARIAQVRLQLRADVIEPAEAKRRKAEEDAKADAAKIVEQGLATAKVLEEITAAYQGSGTSGRDVLLMQKLLPLLESLAGTMGELSVQRLSVLGGADGNGKSGSLARGLVSASEQIKATLGIDVPKVLSDRLGAPAPAKAEAEGPRAAR